MTKLTDPVEILPEEFVKPKIVEQKKVVPVKYYRINLEKVSKTDLNRLMPTKPKDLA